MCMAEGLLSKYTNYNQKETVAIFETDKDDKWPGESITQST